MAYGVIAEHGGHIRVETGLGVGTRFEIQLPAVEEKVDISRNDDVVGPFNRDQSGKILVIDEAELVRELTVELLKEVGFSVMSADSGQDGLALYRLHQPYSVVIVDMIMPEWGGTLSLNKSEPSTQTNRSSLCLVTLTTMWSMV